MQGFGLTPNDEFGTLLELELRAITNEECYEEWTNPEYQSDFNQPSVGVRVRSNLYEGITEQVLCTKVVCNKDEKCKNGETENCLQRNDKCVCSLLFNSIGSALQDL